MREHRVNDLIFPGRGGKKLSDNAARQCIQGLGYKKATAHGLRASAGTLLQEAGYQEDLLKAQLSHDKDRTTAAYLRSPLVAARREMLQHLADLID